MMMLATSITGNVFAQDNRTKSDLTFDLASDYAKRLFYFDLGKGNKMQIELAAIEDLNRVTNIDSLIKVFVVDLRPLKDSLGDEILSRRIDYVVDGTDAKKIRIRQFKENGSTFAVQDGDVAALKLNQDTIHFIGSINYIAKHTLRKPFNDTRYYRVSFFLNDLLELESYADGSLNKKVQQLQTGLAGNPAREWITTVQKGTAFLKSDRSIYAKAPAGYIGAGDYLNFRVSVDLQNYKNYFVPSFSLGAGLIISSSHFKRDIVLSWDPNFFFAKDSANKMRSFRNDFITLTWGQGVVKDYAPRKESHLLFIMSLGYLVKRDGEYFEKNTFRIGAGRLSLFSGKTKIEPVLYFNDFFKGCTPGLRLIQSF